jgi:hypothetical protein
MISPDFTEEPAFWQRSSFYQDFYPCTRKTAENTSKDRDLRERRSLTKTHQNETRENIGETHNPKVGGSNPPPATKALRH